VTSSVLKNQKLLVNGRMVNGEPTRFNSLFRISLPSNALSYLGWFAEPRSREAWLG
jgi:hypothetical protein